MKLAFGQWGEGEATLFLLHGFAASRAAWDHLRPLLASSVRAVAVDLPGHGQSDPCRAPGRRGFEETLKALARTLDELRSGPVDLMGYSQGARLALGLALEWPGRVRRLILESGTAGLRRSRDRKIRQQRDEALARDIELYGVKAFVDRWESLPLFAGLRKLPRGLARSLRNQRLACSGRGLASSLRSVGVGLQPNYWPRLASLRVPTLLLSGRRDVKFTAIARAMARELPMAWCRSFDGAWHAPHLETPAAFAEEVLAFLGAAAAPRFESEAVA